ncbi:MAG: PQQ-binding-like beta-propeller repeat protein [Verrucomicrobia bacterium]|nr:PQQ-binding-like beta-propeller repeat protein [Verrucomicrobiota bacterium]
MNTSEIIFVGVKGHVVAIEKVGGRILWQTKLKGGFLSSGGFVTVLVDGDKIYAHAGGELFCLEALTGRKLWNNALDGFGFDIASLAIEGASVPSQAMMARILQKRAEENNNSSNASSTSGS